MFSILDPIKKIFKSGHKGMVLGIDIGSSSIKVVLIEKFEERIVLRNYGELILGPRAGFSAGQSTSLAPEKIAEALGELLKEAGIISGHTLIAIPFSASLLAVVELPDVGGKDLDSMIMIEARRYIPVPITEVSLDWWVLPKEIATTTTPKSAQVASTTTPVRGNIEVIIAAVQNEVIKKYELIKKNAGISEERSHFEIEIFSTLRAVVGRDLSAVLVIDIGAGSTKLALVDRGVVRGSHVISMGGQDVTLGLSRSKAISFEEAEKIKCTVGVEGDAEGRDVLVVAELILANIMNEAARFAENYERKHERIVSKIIMVGGGAKLKGIEKIAIKNFPKSTVEVGNPFGRVETPAFLDATLKEISPDFAVSLGVALKGLEE